MPSSWDNPNQPDYNYWIQIGEELKTEPLHTLFQNHKGYWFVLPGQKDQIDQNFKKIPWHPSAECTSNINLAGKPITREEAIVHVIPEHKEQEDLDKIAVGYIH